MINKLKALEMLEQEKGIDVDDVRYLGKVTIKYKKEGKKEEEDINVYAILEDKTIKYYTDDGFLLGTETVGVGAIPSPEYLKMYEEGTPIKDIIKNLKQKEIEEQERPQEEREIVSLRELEKKNKKRKEEKENEEDETKKKQVNKEEKEKRKPRYVIEKINPDKTKIDYWKTVKQAFGLPSQVHTLAFAYPDSSEDKVDYANITVFMLDKDGNIIDDLKVDDYFEFDTSTGNNPVRDKVIRHEKDENKGETQIEENRTMIRLKAKNGPDNNTYISLEQKDGLGDNNDINAGRKIVGGTENVEKQLETDKIRVWDSEIERMMDHHNGPYNMNRMFEEATESKESDGYIPSKNADGIADTKVSSQKNILYQCLIKLKENDYISENFSDREIMKVLIDKVNENPDITQEELIKRVEEDMSPDKQRNDDEEYINDGPWRNSMRQR